jgi:hypothetical protein
MNLAFAVVPEAGNGMNTLDLEPDETPITREELDKTLNIGFVREFNQTLLDTDVLREFVFALDELKEITRTTNFPHNRLLNTPDISHTGSAAVCTFNDFAKRAHEPSMYGCAVGVETMQNIVEFLTRDYLRTFSVVLKAFKRDSVMLTLDNESLQVSLKTFSPHHEFGLLTYNNFSEDTVVMFPFHLTRIIDA